MGIEETDREGAAAAAKGGGYRVTLDYIKSQVASVYYVNGDVLRLHASHTDVKSHELPYGAGLGAMTLCMVVLRSGFVVFGKSSPVSPQNYDIELGRKFAYEDALRSLWPLMAFYAKQTVHENKAMDQPHAGHGSAG